MPTKQELQQLTGLRLAEARSLHEAGFYAGAYYLAGYAVELGLKACVCKGLALEDYPESELAGKPFRTHRWEDLLLLAGLRTAFQSLAATDPEFASNWSSAKQWTPEQRYQSGKTLEDSDTLLASIVSEPKGVLPWLSSKW